MLALQSVIVSVLVAGSNLLAGTLVIDLAPAVGPGAQRRLVGRQFLLRIRDRSGDVDHALASAQRREGDPIEPSAQL